MPENKVIVVTGASGSLGRLVVQRFLADGSRVAAVLRRADDARALGLGDSDAALAVAADLTDESQVRACFDRIKTHFRRIDALVHAAGGWEARPFAQTSLEDWKRMMDVNLTTTFLSFREAVRVMAGQGTLIAFASRQGADGGVPEQAAYAAAKAGVMRLIEAVAAEYRDQGITAHAIAPSAIRYDDSGSGVHADDLIELCRSIIERTGEALSGATIRAYGTG